MKRVLLLAVVASCGGALIGSLPPANAANRAAGTKIGLAKTRLGKILVNSKGFTIYAFTADTKKHDNCQNRSGCTGAWPPVTSKGKPVAGMGVRQALLGTIRLKNGQRQVTYNGWPLYTYIGDTQRHQTSYVNFPQFGGRWPALNAAGKFVR